jgi:uncharacterized repeat protein (TIGR02543 family)
MNMKMKKNMNMKANTGIESMARVRQKSIAFVLCIFCMVAYMPYGLHATYAAGTYADIPDSNLKAALNAYLSIQSGTSRPGNAEIDTTSLAQIETLSLDNHGLTDIKGLENCTNLKYLSLNENEIVDVSPLASLSKLDHLYLSGNRISDFSPLSQITGSSYLRINATNQEAEGATIVRTGSAILFPATPKYSAGADFEIWDFAPLGANGTYYSGSNKVGYNPLTSGDTVSYHFVYEGNILTVAGGEINLGGKVTHNVFVPWCVVSFDSGGGIISGAEKTSVIEGYPAATLPAVSRTGYTLKEWSNEAGDTIDEEYIITTDQSITANWTANEYKLFYDLNGGDRVDDPHKPVLFDSKYGTLDKPERKGYTFKGWYSEKSGGAEVTEAAVHTKADDVTAYAQWTPNDYTVTFDAQGGTLAGSSTRTVTYDDLYGEFPTPVKKTKQFDGWHTETAGGKLITETDDVKIEANTTLYAHWSNVDRLKLLVGKDEWKTIGTDKYRLDKKGIPLKGLHRVGKYYYYFDSTGIMQKNKKIKVSGYTLRLNKKGRVTNIPRPNKTTVPSASVKKNGKITVSWHALMGADGYQIKYAKDKYFKKEIGIVTVKGKNALKKTLTRMGKGKRYYVKVRGYLLIGGVKVPGKYSKAVKTDK